MSKRFSEMASIVRAGIWSNARRASDRFVDRAAGREVGGRGIVGGGLTLIEAPAVRRHCKVGDGGEIGGECGHHTLEDGVA